MSSAILFIYIVHFRLRPYRRRTIRAGSFDIQFKHRIDDRKVSTAIYKQCYCPSVSLIRCSCEEQLGADSSEPNT